MNEYEFVLADRIAKIQAINEQYDLENNAYISFSGGKDSIVVSKLVDMALPNNKIPRVYFNTGIEYLDMVEYVKELASKDNRFQIIVSGVNIKKMLEKDGYPFKSKQHAHNWEIYNNNKEQIQEYLDKINANKELLNDYEFIHNLPKGVKTIVKYLFDIRERERELYTSFKGIPNSLQYQFQKDSNFNLKISEKCCYRLKKEVAHKYEKESGKHIAITGIRASEGGMRNQGGCTIFDVDKLHKFHPIKVVSDEWEELFIKNNNIELCKLYYPPYNFERTGCRFCPFALNIQQELEQAFKYLPKDYKIGVNLWKPVFDEYIRIGYRLKEYPHNKTIMYNIFDFIEEKSDK